MYMYVRSQIRMDMFALMSAGGQWAATPQTLGTHRRVTGILSVGFVKRTGVSDLYATYLRWYAIYTAYAPRAVCHVSLRCPMARRFRAPRARLLL